MTLRSGYFSDFKGGPTVLLWGDADAMRQFASTLRTSAIRFGTLSPDSLIEAVDGRPILLKPKTAGTQVIENHAGQRHLEW